MRGMIERLQNTKFLRKFQNLNGNAIIMVIGRWWRVSRDQRGIEGLLPRKVPPLNCSGKMLACNFCFGSVGCSGSGPPFLCSPWRLSTFFVRINFPKSSRPFSRSIGSSNFIFSVIKEKRNFRKSYQLNFSILIATRGAFLFWIPCSLPPYYGALSTPLTRGITGRLRWKFKR